MKRVPPSFYLVAALSTLGDSAAYASLFSGIPECPASKRGDTVCDFECNRREYQYDGGDCCPSGCKAGDDGCGVDLAEYWNVHRTGQTRRSVQTNAELFKSDRRERYNRLTGREVYFHEDASEKNAHGELKAWSYWKFMRSGEFFVDWHKSICRDPSSSDAGRTIYYTGVIYPAAVGLVWAIVVLGVLRWAFCGRRRLRSASVNPENDLESSKAEDRVATTTTEIGSLGMLLAKPGIGLVLLGGMLVAMEYLADVYLVHEVSSRSSHVVASPDSRNFFYPGVLSAIPYQGALVLSRLIILSVVLSILGAIGLLASSGDLTLGQKVSSALFSTIHLHVLQVGSFALVEAPGSARRTRLNALVLRLQWLRAAAGSIPMLCTGGTYYFNLRKMREDNSYSNGSGWADPGFDESTGLNLLDDRSVLAALLLSSLVLAWTLVREVSAKVYVERLSFVEYLGLATYVVLDAAFQLLATFELGPRHKGMATILFIAAMTGLMGTPIALLEGSLLEEVNARSLAATAWTKLQAVPMYCFTDLYLVTPPSTFASDAAVLQHFVTRHGLTVLITVAPLFFGRSSNRSSYVRQSDTELASVRVMLLMALVLVREGSAWYFLRRLGHLNMNFAANFRATCKKYVNLASTCVFFTLAPIVAVGVLLYFDISRVSQANIIFGVFCWLAVFPGFVLSAGVNRDPPAPESSAGSNTAASPPTPPPPRERQPFEDFDVPKIVHDMEAALRRREEGRSIHDILGDGGAPLPADRSDAILHVRQKEKIMLIYTDLEPDDIFAIRCFLDAERDNLVVPPIVVFVASPLKKDKDGILEKKILFASYCHGRNFMENLLVVSNAEDVVVPPPYATNDRGAVLNVAAERLSRAAARYENAEVEILVLAPGHGNLGILHERLFGKHWANWKTARKRAFITMYSGAFNISQMEMRDVDFMVETTNNGAKPLVDVAHFPYVGGTKMIPKIKNLAPFIPTLSADVKRVNPFLACTWEEFAEAFDKKLLDPLKDNGKLFNKKMKEEAEVVAALERKGGDGDNLATIFDMNASDFGGDSGDLAACYVDFGSGQTMIYLFAISDDSSLHYELVYEDKGCFIDKDEEARAAVRSTFVAQFSKVAETLEAYPGRTLQNLFRVFLGATAKYRTAQETDPQSVEAVDAWFQGVISESRLMAGRPEQELPGVEFHTISGTEEARYEWLAIKEACAVELQAPHCLCSAGNGSLQVSMDDTFLTVDCNLKEGGAFVEKYGAKEYKKSIVDDIEGAFSRARDALKTIRSPDKPLRLVMISSFYYAALACKAITKGEPPRYRDVGQLLSAAEALLDSNSASPKDKANVSRLLNVLEVMTGGNFNNVQILILREFAVRGKPYKATWMTGKFIDTMKQKYSSGRSRQLSGLSTSEVEQVERYYADVALIEKLVGLYKANKFWDYVSELNRSPSLMKKIGFKSRIVHSLATYGFHEGPLCDCLCYLNSWLSKNRPETLARGSLPEWPLADFWWIELVTGRTGVGMSYMKQQPPFVNFDGKWWTEDKGETGGARPGYKALNLVITQAKGVAPKLKNHEDLEIIDAMSEELRDRILSGIEVPDGLPEVPVVRGAVVAGAAKGFERVSSAWAEEELNTFDKMRAVQNRAGAGAEEGRALSDADYFFDLTESVIYNANVASFRPLFDIICGIVDDLLTYPLGDSLQDQIRSVVTVLDSYVPSAEGSTMEKEKALLSQLKKVQASLRAAADDAAGSAAMISDVKESPPPLNLNVDAQGSAAIAGNTRVVPLVEAADPAVWDTCRTSDASVCGYAEAYAKSVAFAADPRTPRRGRVGAAPRKLGYVFVTHNWEDDGPTKARLLASVLFWQSHLTSTVLMATMTCILSIPLSIILGEVIFTYTESLPSVLAESTSFSLCILCLLAGVAVFSHGKCTGIMRGPLSLSRIMLWIDKCCIDQSGADEIKQRSLRQVHRYVSEAEKLAVLFSDSYVQSLWCVFELAYFCKSHPDVFNYDSPSLLFLPLDDADGSGDLETQKPVASGRWVWWRCARSSISESACRRCVRGTEEDPSPAQRDVHPQAVKLTIEQTSNLRNFSCRRARTFAPRDRAVILWEIRRLWGSEEAFDVFVRNEVPIALELGKRRYYQHGRAAVREGWRFLFGEQDFLAVSG